MCKIVEFEYNTVIDYLYDVDGHRHVRVPMFFEKDSYSNDTTDFVFDTGAYLTVLTKNTAERFGFNLLIPVQKNIPLTGFADSKCNGDLIEIPGILLGGKRLEDVRVAIPYIDTEDDILGLNVLEHFNYLIDSKNDKIYFSDNPIYKPPKELGCGKIYKVKSVS
ncbi:MAG: retroviral-like aspartic protease family protein [Oscillospiraceae bacterium]|jgi:predicted aspartyl protease|nr:retroviral-like aspartic protease family protein [Oscillospiraceae bacterium]